MGLLPTLWDLYGASYLWCVVWLLLGCLHFLFIIQLCLPKGYMAFSLFSGFLAVLLCYGIWGLKLGSGMLIGECTNGEHPSRLISYFLCFASSVLEWLLQWCSCGFERPDWMLNSCDYKIYRMCVQRHTVIIWPVMLTLGFFPTVKPPVPRYCNRAYSCEPLGLGIR